MQVEAPSELERHCEEIAPSDRDINEGKLGHTAKVSGTGPSAQGSHVICVYVDPFWEVAEVERVLSALRLECCIADAIKFKVDGVTLLNLAKDNEFGIHPSFYSAARESLALTVQTTFKGQGAQQWGKNGKAGRGSYLHTKQEVAGSWRPAPSSSSSQSAAAAAASQPPPAMKEKTKKKPETQGSAFAALAGCLGCPRRVRASLL